MRTGALTRYRTIARYKSPKGDREYTVKLNLQSGRLTCDCPIWIYNIWGNRSCLHTDKVYKEFDIDQVLLGRLLSA